MLTALGPSLIAMRGYAAAEVERVYLRSRELCRELGEEQQQFWALWGLWVLHYVRADLEEAFELARQLMRLAELGDDPVYLVEALSALGLSHVERGEIILAAAVSSEPSPSTPGTLPDRSPTSPARTSRSPACRFSPARCGSRAVPTRRRSAAGRPWTWRAGCDTRSVRLSP